MLLYLMRHCEPEEGERNDSSRQLTPEGWRQAEQMGEFLRREIGSAEIVMTSPYARAADTAMTVAKALGCQHVPQSNWLDPDSDVERAWDHIAATAGKRETVVVVTHHPLINALLEKLTGAKTDDVHYVHGAVAHLKPESGKLRWLVTPKLVERDEDLLDAAADVAEAAAELAQPVSESLKHPKHAATLKPIRDKSEAIMRRFFRRQRIALLKQIDTHLKHLGDGNKNVKEDYMGKGEVDSVLPKGSLLPLSFSAGMAADYSDALTAALVGGYSTLADDFDSDGEISKDIVEEYLRDHSLRKLTGNINATTVERLRNALADTYEAGGNYYDLKQAVIDEFDNFSDTRAGMIAQTELNGAWNSGRKQLGVDLGFNEKSWNPDVTACPLCLLNVAEGWIGMDDEFESGDDAPPLHPNCLLPGAAVTAFGVSLAIRRRYKGTVCEITLASGPKLAVTPNHPIATPSGFVAAGTLNDGDYVFECIGPSDPPRTLANPHNDYVESRIEEIFDSLVVARGGAARGVPVSPEAFHGDRSVNDEIDIVDAAGDFAANVTEGADNLEDPLLADSHRGWVSGAGRSGLAPLIERNLAPTDSRVSGSALGYPRFRAHAGGANESSLATSSLDQSQLTPPMEDSWTAYSRPDGNLKQALPFKVRLVKLSGIKRFDFDGHVYNLETVSGTYSANSILVHNCDCSLDVRYNAQASES